MLRKQYTFTYTAGISYVETQVVDALMKLAGKQDRTLEEEEAARTLTGALPEVTQVRITVTQVNGLGRALYDRLSNDARQFFSEQSGIDGPLKDDTDLTPEQESLLSVAFAACASMASTSKFEQRTTKPIVAADGVTFDDSPKWEPVALPGPFKTLEEWVYECPDTLQKAWANAAYDANIDLWRRSQDPVAKNFGAVSGTALKKR